MITREDLKSLGINVETTFGSMPAIMTWEKEGIWEARVTLRSFCMKYSFWSFLSIDFIQGQWYLVSLKGDFNIQDEPLERHIIPLNINSIEDIKSLIKILK